MEDKNIVAETEQRAREYFRQGLNCAECVLLAFLDTHETGYPKETVGIASGFGGGIGRTKHICGAVSAAVIALGTVKGRANPFEREEPRERSKQLGQEIYPQFAEMIAEVEAHFGTSTCADMTKSYQDFEGKERKRNCQEIVAYCAALAARYAEK